LNGIEVLADEIGKRGGVAAILGGLAGMFVLYPDACVTELTGGGLYCVNVFGWDALGFVGAVNPVVGGLVMSALIGLAFFLTGRESE
jgi:hypothetical protein